MIVNVAGLGRVSSSIIYNLKDKVEIGYILSRDKEKAKNFVKEIGKGIPVDYSDDFKFEDILFVGYSDSVLLKAPELLEKFIGKQVSAIHFSGYFSSKIFPSDWNPSSIHPNCPIPRKETKLKNVIFGIEGNIELAKNVVTLLEGRYFIIPENSKSFYHLAAVLMSNFPHALVFLAERLYEIGKIEKKNFYEVMESLLINTVKNIKKNGTVESITGPIARKDIEIVRSEREIFCRNFPEFCQLYEIFVQIISSMNEEK
ncbi:MAG: hypothetical protein PWP02_278 [Thermosipho sp. (in: thermotogales)]|nr:hypothetical protein [Thermosipho sp. (in: thermotogales)]